MIKLLSYTRFFTGLIFLGLGVSCALNANLGAAPWDVMLQGTALSTGWSFLAANLLLNAITLVLWLPFKKIPNLFTLLAAFTISLTIQLATGFIPTSDDLVSRGLLLSLGIILLGLGIGTYLAAGLGASAYEGLALAIAGKRSLVKTRTILELGVLAIGFILGGTVGVGTILIALLVSPLVGLILKLHRRLDQRWHAPAHDEIPFVVLD